METPEIADEEVRDEDKNAFVGVIDFDFVSTKQLISPVIQCTCTVVYVHTLHGVFVMVHAGRWKIRGRGHAEFPFVVLRPSILKTARPLVKPWPL